MAGQVIVRPMTDEDRAWAHALIDREWGGLAMVTRGVLHDMRVLPGVVAWHEGARVGLATYRLDGAECEVMSLNSLVEGAGIGTALLEAVAEVSRAAGCRRVFLITTNDNTPALRFYQRRGFRLVALRPGAIDAARRLKPGIPAVGLDGIPLRDEIELEQALDE
ncbi:MAG: GNAT family N-acetyltransferase [Anaerolineae bacterium]|nr:GNAT family N-acetyltransferase [Anaerolineae bacterium]